MPVSAPSEDEFEVSVFGPGRGESCVLHLGAGDWIIVDSCRDQRSGTTAPLQYLEALGVDLQQQVKLVIATHAHDDHISGISEIFRACESATFVHPTALSREEFAVLVEIDIDETTDLRKRNYGEFERVQRLIEERGAVGRRPLMYAIQDRELYARTPDSGIDVRVRSLSPSDTAFEQTIVKLKSYFPELGSDTRPVVVDPNELAIALWIEVGEHAALLGADILDGPEGCGWSAVLQSFSPRRKAGVYKVAHHGSRTSNHSGLWDSLLVEQPVAILAPYRARHVVPSGSEISDLLARTERLYAAADPRVPTPQRSVRKSAATLSQLARNVRDPWGSVGHVRARATPDGEWAVETFGPATVLR